MIVLFCERKSKTEKEITEILKNMGGNYISDKSIFDNSGNFTIITEYKVTDICADKGIAIFCENTKKFASQILPVGFIGICEDKNKNALDIFKKNNTPVITCGMNPKNTITLSSITKSNALVCIQRTLENEKGSLTEPFEINIDLSKNYNPFSITTSVAVLLLNGIIPKTL